MLIFELKTCPICNSLLKKHNYIQFTEVNCCKDLYHATTHISFGYKNDNTIYRFGFNYKKLHVYSSGNKVYVRKNDTSDLYIDLDLNINTIDYNALLSKIDKLALFF